MEDKYKAAIAGIGIVCLTAIELYALEKGVDSVMMTSIVGAIAGFVGLCFGFVLKGK